MLSLSSDEDNKSIEKMNLISELEEVIDNVIVTKSKSSSTRVRATISSSLDKKYGTRSNNRVTSFVSELSLDDNTNTDIEKITQ